MNYGKNMENLNISIIPPITEWCRDCDYAAHKSFYAFSAKCPKCQSSSVGHGPKLNKVVNVWVSKGSYGIKLSGGLADEQYCYTFSNTPLEKQGFSILSDNEYDTDSVFDLMIELSSDNSISPTNKILINSFIKYISDNPDYQESQERKIADNQRMRMEHELFRLNKVYNFYI